MYGTGEKTVLLKLTCARERVSDCQMSEHKTNTAHRCKLRQRILLMNSCTRTHSLVQLLGSLPLQSCSMHNLAQADADSLVLSSLANDNTSHSVAYLGLQKQRQSPLLLYPPVSSASLPFLSPSP